MAQRIAYSKYPNRKYLVLDSDIILPKNLLELIDFNIDNSCLYGIYRYFIDNIHDFDKKKKTELGGWGWKKGPLGYFNLYSNKNLYDFSDTAGMTDELFFRNNFSKYCMINSYVYHLGKPNQNWDSKKYIFREENQNLRNKLNFSCSKPKANIYKNKNNDIIRTQALN